MIRHVASLLLLSAAVAGAATPQPPRRALAQGRDAFHTGDFATAAQAFQEAAAQAPDAGLDPAVAHLNAGNALFRAGRLAEAFDAFARARQTTDLALQARALFNAATCRFRQCQAALTTEGQGTYVEPYLNDALTLFAQAMLLAPDDEDAKVNFELAQDLQAQLASAAAVLSQVMGEAGRLLDAYRFEEAAKVLQQGAPVARMAAALERPEANAYQAMMQRCAQVVGILQQPSGAQSGSTPP